MKTIKKIPNFLLLMMLCFIFLVQPVSAAMTTQDGLQISLTTDKEEYSEGEEILLNITLKNTNQKEVTNVALVELVSEGYELDAEAVEALKQIGDLSAGKEVAFSLKATAKEPSDINTKPGNQGGPIKKIIETIFSPKTADNSRSGIWLVILIAVCVGAVVFLAVKNKKQKEVLSFFLCTTLLGSALAGTGMSVSAAEITKKIVVEKIVKYAGKDASFKAEFAYTYTQEDTPDVPDVPDTPDVPDVPDVPDTPDTPDVPDTPMIPEDPTEEYTLMWEDEFEGTELNREDWNVELHEPGWVNNELQKYVDSTDNIYVKDGNLVIQALKSEDGEGNVTYTSGRVNTRNKQDYKYGKFEARIKVPTGKGFLPAFWMMPTDESFYGQWPKCGEIDICEVLGSDTDKSYGTIHFGEPHTERQGSYTLAEGDFASEFHVFAVEWEPGEIRWYLDGELFHSANDWFTKRAGYDEVAYPAPFDQPFYMILNLAVGGNWPGNPDETTTFDEKAQLVVDYVRVYQKDSYDENVTKPEAVLREPDSTGNYVINGDFAVAEDLSEAEDWQFLLAEGGEGAATISDGKMVITSTATGTQNHSVQLVQPGIPMEQGWRYRITFDAYADAERTMIADVSAPDVNWIRYFADTTVNLTTSVQTFSYTFDMVEETDANGRVEFNLGNQPSTATVYIDNVRVEKVEQIAIEEEAKTILPDGNYVYNSTFDQGDDRLLYWEVENNAGAQYSVTNANNVREFKAVIPSGIANLSDVVLKQPGLALSGGKEYVLSFDAYADGEKTIQTQIAGQTFDSALTTTKTTYKYTLNTAADASDFDLKFLLGVAGTIYLDNVRIQEDGMLINGDFSNGTTGYEVYAYNANDVDYWVDELNEDSAFTIKISDTGAQDWHIQLKQNNITLEKDKWYKLSLDAKSTMNRTIMYALQRDGSADDVWTSYSGTEKIDLTSTFATFEHTFQMKNTTDEATILSISMGAVNGIQITDEHTVVIDNIVLEETEAPATGGGENPDGEEDPDDDTDDDTPVDGGVLKNANFANNGENWSLYVHNGEDATAAGTVSYADGKATVTVTNPGITDWHVKLLQNGLTLENGATYQVRFNMKSDATRFVSFGLQPSDYSWYKGGEWIYAGAGVDTVVDKTITIDGTKCDGVEFGISMGYFNSEDVPTPAESVIEISNISIVKISDGDDSGDQEEEETTVDSGFLKNVNFANNGKGWNLYVYDGTDAAPAGTVNYADGKATVTVTNPGTADWHVKLLQNGVTLEAGATYQVQFTVKSSATRFVSFGLQPSDYSWYKGGEWIYAGAGVDTVVDKTITIDGTKCDEVEFGISMGYFSSEDVPTPTESVIEISNITITKIDNTPINTVSSGDVF